MPLGILYASGFCSFITEDEIDIIMLQEIKCTNEQFPYEQYANEDKIGFNIGERVYYTSFSDAFRIANPESKVGGITEKAAK